MFDCNTTRGKLLGMNCVVPLLMINCKFIIGAQIGTKTTYAFFGDSFIFGICMCD